MNRLKTWALTALPLVLLALVLGLTPTGPAIAGSGSTSGRKLFCAIDIPVSSGASIVTATATGEWLTPTEANPVTAYAIHVVVDGTDSVVQALVKVVGGTRDGLTWTETLNGNTALVDGNANDFLYEAHRTANNVTDGVLTYSFTCATTTHLKRISITEVRSDNR